MNVKSSVSPIQAFPSFAHFSSPKLHILPHFPSPILSILLMEMTETVTLCKGGDVLIASSQSAAKVFLVSSHILSNASSVFDNMLNGNFAEGERFRSRGSEPFRMELNEPEEALEMLLCLSHCRAVESSLATVPRHVYGLAVICDKFLCSTVAKSMIDFAVISTKRSNMSQTAYLAAAAAITGATNEFRKLTSSLVKDYEESITSLFLDKTGMIKPVGIRKLPIDFPRCKTDIGLDHLLEQQRKAMNNVSNSVKKVGCFRDCDCYHDLDDLAVDNLRKDILIKSFQGFTKDASTVLSLVSSYDDITSCSDHSDDEDEYAARVAEEFDQTCQRALDQCQGLCLHCYLGDKDTMGTCTEKHAA